ncbi:hypothetical protein BDV19DRAFT_194144 [Aspergillus venezuelensis]
MIDMSLHAAQDSHPMLDLELPLPTVGSLVKVTIKLSNNGKNTEHACPGIIVRPPTGFQSSSTLFVNPLCTLVFCELDIDYSQLLAGKLALSPAEFPYQQAAFALRSVLYDKSKSNEFLRRVLLARDVRLTCAEPWIPVDQQTAEHIKNLTRDYHLHDVQVRAIRLAFTLASRPDERFQNLIATVSGSAGSGKTRVSACITILIFYRTFLS